MSFQELSAKLHLLDASEEYWNQIAVLVDMPVDKRDEFRDTIINHKLDVLVDALTDMGVDIPRRTVDGE